MVYTSCLQSKMLLAQLGEKAATVAGEYDFNPTTGTKLCSRCKQTKVCSMNPKESSFGRNNATRDGFKYYCKTCVNELHREWAAKNPEKVAAARERQKLRRQRAFDLLRKNENMAGDEQPVA